MSLRIVRALLVSACVPTSVFAGNASNYVHLVNGVDFVMPQASTSPSIFSSPGGTALYGFWNCIDKESLYAPTMVVDPADSAFGTYAAKLDAVEINVTNAVGGPIQFPLIVLSSGPGTCTFLSGSALNWGIASGFGNGFRAIVGPVGSGPATVRAAFPNVSFPNPNIGGSTLYTLALTLTGGASSAVTIPEGENLTIFLHGDPAQTAAAPDGVAGSLNELALCSSHSYMVNSFASGAMTPKMFAFTPSFEWAFGVSSIDAVLQAYVPPGPSGAEANGVFGIDGGSGAADISISALGPGRFGFLVRDDDHPTGCGRFVLGNVAGFRTCFNVALALPSGGPGGPVISTAIPQEPRIVGRVDAMTSAILRTVPHWLMLTGFDTVPGALNGPWVPIPSSGPVGASGVTGGTLLTVPNHPMLPGIELLWWSHPLNGSIATATAVDPLVNDGHSNSLSCATRFLP